MLLVSGSACLAGLCSESDMQKELGSDVLNECMNEGRTSPSPSHGKHGLLGTRWGQKAPGSPGPEVGYSEQQSWLGE